MEGIADAFEVVVRVGLKVGIPRNLLGKDHFAAPMVLIELRRPRIG